MSKTNSSYTEQKSQREGHPPSWCVEERSEVMTGLLFHFLYHECTHLILLRRNFHSVDQNSQSDTMGICIYLCMGPFKCIWHERWLAGRLSSRSVDSTHTPLSPSFDFYTWRLAVGCAVMCHYRSGRSWKLVFIWGNNHSHICVFGTFKFTSFTGCLFTVCLLFAGSILLMLRVTHQAGKNHSINLVIVCPSSVTAHCKDIFRHGQ